MSWVLAAVALGLAAHGPIRGAVAAEAVAPAPARGSLAAQTNREGGVTVKVTPKSLGREQATWDFEVVLDTHSKDLSEDLSRVSMLVDANGAEHAPLAWEGDPAGGHHRQGLLKFKPLPAGTAAITLRIGEVGGVPSRVFQWRLD
jgi:hypothetical protein